MPQRTLWQQLRHKVNQWIDTRVEATVERDRLFGPKPAKTEPVYNPLNITNKSIVSVSDIDLAEQHMSVTQIDSYKRNIGDLLHYFTDVVLASEDKIVEDHPTSFEVRVRFNENNPDDVLVLKIDDEMPFSQDFYTVISDSGGVFNIDEEDGSPPMQFKRLNDLKTPYEATVNSVPTTGVVRSKKIKYWDFSRTAQDEAGQDFEEFLFVEMDSDSGSFRLLRGKLFPVSSIVVI